MRRLRDEGVGIIFVTHFLEQVYAVCDRITVLRNGELVGEYETKDLPRVMLVAKMMGKDFDDLADIKSEHKDKKQGKPEPVIEAIFRSVVLWSDNSPVWTFRQIPLPNIL